MCVQAGGASPAVAAKVAKAKVNIQLASQRKSNVANKVQHLGSALMNVVLFGCCSVFALMACVVLTWGISVCALLLMQLACI